MSAPQEKALRSFARKFAVALNEQSRQFPDDIRLLFQAVALALLDAVEEMQNDEFAELNQ